MAQIVRRKGGHPCGDAGARNGGPEASPTETLEHGPLRGAIVARDKPRDGLEHDGRHRDPADSVANASALRLIGFSAAQAGRVPALVVPLWDVHGRVAFHQARPDYPRVRDGKPVKYETPNGVRMALDVHPVTRSKLGDPAVPLIVTEGVRKADAALSSGVHAVALLGVWNWRGTNGSGDKTALPDWDQVALESRRVYLAFDS